MTGFIEVTDRIEDHHLATLREWKHFDAEWYSREYPDVGMLGLDPAYHYLWLGAKIGRRPSAGVTRLPSRSLRIDELVRDIERSQASDDPLFQETFEDEQVGRRTAEFIQPGNTDAGTVQGLRVGVHAHMYYADLAEEFIWHLSQIPCRFDLYASTANETDRQRVEALFRTIPNASCVEVRVVPNVGRDIAPFLVEFGRELAKYDIVCHIQTKKSLYNHGSTDGWRESTLHSLFEDPETIAFYLRSLQTGRYGMIYPQCFHNLPYMANTWLANAGLAHTWAPRFKVERLPRDYFDFPAGSMFWARADAIRPLLEAGLEWSDFPPETGQTDGTLAHCIERMLGVVVTSRHYLHGVIPDTRHPSWSRWRMEQFTDRPLDHIHAAILDPTITVVAFDIFDTLLTRPLLDPDYVKTLLHAEYEREGRCHFKSMRVRAEAEARAVRGRDIDIHEIYRHFAPASAHISNQLAADREIELEGRSVRPRQEIIGLLDFAIRSGKVVILASDMFLPQDAIEDMLARCGVKGWKTLYLSSQLGVRKETGDLYRHILHEEGISPRQMLMIGDNERSDVQIPTDMGIGVVHVLKPVSLLRATPRLGDLVPDAEEAPLADQFLFGAIAADRFSAVTYSDFQAKDMFGSSARAIGYGLLGPITVAFSQWLLDQAQGHSVNRLYFLAREGKFLREVFDRWNSRIEPGQGSAAVRSDYLLVSRRAVTVPCMETIEDIFAVAMSDEFYDAPMETFLSERFGTILDDATWQRCTREGLWDRERPLTILQGDIDPIRPFLRAIAPHIFQSAQFERQPAIDYLSAMGLTSDARAAVVDVGYGATIQRQLIKLLGQKVDGFYMMTDRRGAALGAGAGVVSQGCFVHGAQRAVTASPLLVHSFILEKMLSADDEQVMRYSADGNAIFREPFDQAGESTRVRQDLQHGALEFVTDAVRFRDDMGAPLQIGKAHCETLFTRFVSQMSASEKTILAALALDDFYCGRGIVTD